MQRYQFARYHVTDAGDFYQGNDRWEVPRGPRRDAASSSRRTACSSTSDGEPTAASTWALTSVFVPRGKSNLAAFVSVNSDATDRTSYGKMQVLELTDDQRAGPGQIANEMRQDDAGRCATSCSTFNRRRDATDLRQPAHAAGRATG